MNCNSTTKFATLLLNTAVLKDENPFKLFQQRAQGYCKGLPEVFSVVFSQVQNVQSTPFTAREQGDNLGI